jgi:hypothetical protein
MFLTHLTVLDKSSDQEHYLIILGKITSAIDTLLTSKYDKIEEFKAWKVEIRKT